MDKVNKFLKELGKALSQINFIVFMALSTVGMIVEMVIGIIEKICSSNLF